MAISNYRIISNDSQTGMVSFRYKDYADGNAEKIMPLKGEEFIRRFEQHILPKGFTKVTQCPSASCVASAARIFLLAKQFPMSASIEFRQSMFSLIEQWKVSGLSQKSFCAQQGIVAHSFYYWYKCYRSQTEISCHQVSPGFVEITPADRCSPVGTIELFSSTGHRVVFHQPVSAAFIKALIH